MIEAFSDQSFISCNMRKFKLDILYGRIEQGYVH